MSAHRRNQLKPAEAIAAVREIYSELASRPIERNCEMRTECCQFKLTGRTPYLTAGEALVAASALRATGRAKLPVPSNGACPLLDPATSRCMIYDNRPFGCRTHFCRAAGGPYARREVSDLIHKLEEIGRKIDGGEARPLPAAVAEILAK